MNTYNGYLEIKQLLILAFFQRSYFPRITPDYSSYARSKKTKTRPLGTADILRTGGLSGPQLTVSKHRRGY